MLYIFILIMIGRGLYAAYTHYTDRSYQRRWDATSAPEEGVAPPSLPQRPPVEAEHRYPVEHTE